ncbi:MAG: hypothetical protein B7Z40_22935, partial [Bosea sp. 12-68-7]
SPQGVGVTIIGTADGDDFDGTNDGDTIDADPNPTSDAGGNDNIHGQNGDDVINGGAGNDTLYGDNGEDELFGNSGNDSLNGGNNNDTLHGGTDDDTLNGDNGDDILFGDEGNDTFNDDSNSNTMDGGAGDDLFNNLGYRTGLDTVTGGTGRDTFDLELFWLMTQPANRQADIITDFEAGPNGDYLFLESYTNGSVFTNFDVNTQNPFATGHLVLVQNGADTILRGSVDGVAANLVDLVVLQGVTATDLVLDNFRASGMPNGIGPSPTGTGLTIVGTQFGDDFDGSNDADIIYGDSDLSGATGTGDTIRGQDGNDTLYGLAGADNLQGLDGNDALEGGQGNDTLGGGEGDDILSGGAEDDNLSGSNGNDQLDGGDGDDTLDGDAGNDDVSGGTGNDIFNDYQGTNTLDGGDGDDFFRYALYSYSGSAIQTVTGGSGSDLFDLYANSLTTSSPNQLTITDFEAGASGDVLRIQDLSSLFATWDQTSNPFTQGYLGFSVSDLDGDGQSDDTTFFMDRTGGSDGVQAITLARLFNVDPNDLTAANFSTTNYGQGAFWEPDGSLRVINGSERPENNQWNPSIVGSLAGDQIFGGAGAETISGNRGSDEIHGGSGRDSISGDEGDDTIFGDESDDTLSGNNGNDTLDGGEGDDVMYGNAGDDDLEGGLGDDYLYDWQGTNTLSGGDGADFFESMSHTNDGGQTTAWGGAGRDTFVVNPDAYYYTSFSGQTGNLPDIIADFQAGAGSDILNLTSWSSSWFTGWDPATNPFSGGFIRFLVADADGDGTADDVLVQGDYDGSGVATYSFGTGVILLDVDPAE